jgi:EAL domain-containing protein (putative c-di-GMP-specific phosphodiesterase class I)
VGDIETEDQFTWWRSIGADTVLGGFTGAPGPVDDLKLG